MPKLIPRAPVPELSVPTVGHGNWTLKDRTPRTFSLIVVYRGLHCPLCKGYLNQLKALHGEYRQRGIDVLAVSTDAEERARRTYDEWGLSGLTLGYALPLETAREWRLYVSSARENSDEPAYFAEPGLFVVKPDQTLYAAAVNTMPFARPSLKELLGALDFVIAQDYPARGEA